MFRFFFGKLEKQLTLTRGSSFILNPALRSSRSILSVFSCLWFEYEIKTKWKRIEKYVRVCCYWYKPFHPFHIRSSLAVWREKHEKIKLYIILNKVQRRKFSPRKTRLSPQIRGTWCSLCQSIRFVTIENQDIFLSSLFALPLYILIDGSKLFQCAH